MPKWLFLLVRLRQRLWVTVALYSVLGLVAALLASAFGDYVPEDFPLKLGSDSVDDILTILASSLLAVTTFSLATLVTAYTATVSSIAPHAAKLLVSDQAVSNALATFVGGFIYSIVGIIALHTGYYGAQGRVILFFITLVVLVLVIVAMLRWIGQLSSLAQTDEVIDRVAAVAAAALAARVTALRWCADAWEPPSDGLPVPTEEVGFVRNIDLDGLEEAAGRLAAVVYVEAAPGDFVHPGQPLFRVSGAPRLSTAAAGDLRSHFTVGRRRTFEQDPRYGLTVLGEIAGRALSPGVNDPGTARDVISSATAVLIRWVQEHRRNGDAKPVRNVRFRPLDGVDLLEDALGTVARDGAGHGGLQRDLQTALEALARSADAALADAARSFSTTAVELANDRLVEPAMRTAVAAQARAVRMRET